MKGLVALVSVFALVVSLGPLARVASAETYAASYAVLSPPTMLSGAFATVGLRVTNTGTSTWNATGSQPVSASYHWLRGDGSGFSWDGERTGFGADVPPGASRLVNVRVYGAPGSPGGYRLQIALVKEGVAWFPPSGSVSVAVVTRSTAALQASLSASPPPTLLAGGSANVDVAVTNVGASTWPATGAQPVNLSYHWYDANGKVVVWDGARTSLGSDLAASAPARTLQATVRAPTTAGTYFLVFEMVREGVGWFGAQAALATFVGDPAHSATYVVAPSASGFIGEQRAFDVTVRNVGGSSWPSTGANAVHLSYHWRDAQGALVVWDGMRTSLGGDVAPGTSRTIALAVQTPNRAGAYTLAVDLVQEGVTWFSQAGAEPAYSAWQITTGYAASYGASTMAASAVSGASVSASVTLTNSGQRAWPIGGPNPVRLSYHVYDSAGRLVVWDGERGLFSQDVAPGATVNATITVRVPTATGGYGIGWDLVQEGVGWFSDFGVVIRKDVVIVAPGVTFYGKGWGHGVGMSQWGAQGWAQGAAGAKKTGEEIIAFYYPGTQLSPASPSLSTIRVQLSAPSDGCIARTITTISQQRSAGGMRVWNEATGATIATASGSMTWAPQQTVRIWIDNDNILHVMDEWAAKQLVAVSGPIRVTPLDATQPITVDQKGSRAYRGDLRFAVASANALSVVNLVGIDDYAKGAVPAEMPTGFGWEYEAFKAQAYAAKTYAANMAVAHSAQPFDVADDTSDQCYGGASKETALTSQAVGATAGRIITYNGQPIRAYYSSSNGGATERDGCVFDLVPSASGAIVCNPSQPYLLVVTDPADPAASDSRGPNPHRSWNVSVTAQDIVDAVRERTGTDIGTFVSLDLSNRAGSGRVVSARVQGSRATVELTGPSLLRAGLGLKSTRVYLSPF